MHKLSAPQKFPSCSIPVIPHNTPPNSPGNHISAFFLCHGLVLPAIEFHIDGITQYGLFYMCLLSFNGEGNGTPLQYACLENPVDGGAL